MTISRQPGNRSPVNRPGGVRPMKKLAAAIVIALVTAVSLFSASSFALEGEKMTFRVGVDESVKASFLPIPSNDPIGLFHHPGDCAGSADCTEIPLEVILPDDFDPETGDFVVFVTLTWDLAGSPDENAVNDLDMYVYDLTTVDEEGEPEPQIAAQSATGSMPEVAKMFSPLNKDYAILVSNFAGPNTGFNIELTFKDYSFEPPFEGEDPSGTPAGGGSNGSSEPPASDPDSSGGQVASPVIPSAGDDPIASIPLPAPGTPQYSLDNDFGEGFENDPLSLTTDDSGGAASLFRKASDLGPPSPVGGTVLAAWLGLAPLALLVGSVLFILKRRPPALSMTFAVPNAASTASDA
jgi:hypothetical protein